MASDHLSRRDALKATAALGAGAMLTGLAGCAAGAGRSTQTSATTRDTAEEARRFLRAYDAGYQPLYYAASKGEWLASTDVSDAHTEASVAAQTPLNDFVGEKSRVETIQHLRQNSWRLDPLTNRQVSAAFFLAAQYPGTIPELVAARTEAEAQQGAAQDGYRFTLHAPGKPAEAVTANDLDGILTDSTDEALRKAAWDSAKEIGVGLKKGLVNLRGLRNGCAKELGFSSFFGLKVGEYGMSPAELSSLSSTVLEQTRPLFEQIHCYAKHTLAERFKRPVPRRIPAHWRSS